MCFPTGWSEGNKLEGKWETRTLEKLVLVYRNVHSSTVCNSPCLDVTQISISRRTENCAGIVVRWNATEQWKATATSDKWDDSKTSYMQGDSIPKRFQSKTHKKLKIFCRRDTDGKIMSTNEVTLRGPGSVASFGKREVGGRVHGQPTAYDYLGVDFMIHLSSDFCIMHSPPCMREITIKTEKQGLVSCSAPCSCTWFGVDFTCLQWGEREHSLTYTWKSSRKVNYMLAPQMGLRFWKGKL